MAHGDGAEQPVEQEESDAEIADHAAVVVQGMMMNVVQPAGGKKPATKEGISRHPKIAEVHAVVQIAEGNDWPDNQSGERDALKEDRDAQEKHDCPQYCENGSGRNKPFQADVSRRKTIGSRVVVVVTAHGLARAIDQEVVDQVAAAEKRNFVAVQQAM